MICAAAVSGATRPWRTTLAPILTSFSRSAVSDQCSTSLGDVDRYPEPELSDIPLEWMLQMAEKHGLKIYPRHRVEVHGHVDGTMHDSRGSLLTRLYRRQIRSWPTKTHGKPRIHESVQKRTLNQHNEKEPPYKPWILDGSYDYETESWERA